MALERGSKAGELSTALARLSSGRSCGKRVYRTSKKAQKALDLIRAIKGSGHTDMQNGYYKCRSCDYWHLTSQHNAGKQVSTPQPDALSDLM